ncbi:MAG TPA: hypothetical protein VFR86_18930 [Burkholderiaceae bacterium]|nr:hypothetical protein [Burkholderiaceae bacterium]
MALEYTEAMTYADRGVDDDPMARLKQHFTDDAVVELTGPIAFQNPIEQVQQRGCDGAAGLLPSAAACAGRRQP